MNESLYNKSILVIDDELAMLEIVKAVLKRAGALPIGASSIERGLQAASSQHFDAIILDRYMPDGDGHDVLKELKSRPKTKITPVVMLTGEKSMSEIQTSIKLGAVGYIVKPFTPKSFLGQLDKILADKFEIDLG